MKKEVIDISTAREIEKIMREENELEKNENESEDGVVGHSREQELESRKICQKFILFYFKTLFSFHITDRINKMIKAKH